MLSWINAHFGFRWMVQVDVLQFGIPFFLLVTGVATLDLMSPSGNGLISRVTGFLGDASYSIYLTHFMVIQTAASVAKIMNLPSVSSFVFAVGMALLVGIFVFVIFERPLMRKLDFVKVNADQQPAALFQAHKKNISPLFFMVVGAVLAACVIKNIPGRIAQEYESRVMIKRDSWPFAESVRLRQDIESRQQKRLVMLGDSLIQWGKWEGGLGEYTLFNYGVGGNKTSDVLSRLAGVEKRKPSKVVLMVGINDIFAGVSEADIVKNYEAIVRRLVAARIDVVAVSVVSLSKHNSRYMETNIKVFSLNERIVELASRLDIDYLNLVPDLTTPSTFVLADEFTVDSVHLSSLAYAKWTIRLNKYLNQKP